MKKISQAIHTQNGQIINIPQEFELRDVRTASLEKKGDSLLITPVKKYWLSLLVSPKADDDFLTERISVIEDR